MKDQADYVSVAFHFLGEKAFPILVVIASAYQPMLSLHLCALVFVVEVALAYLRLLYFSLCECGAVWEISIFQYGLSFSPKHPTNYGQALFPFPVCRIARILQHRRCSCVSSCHSPSGRGLILVDVHTTRVAVECVRSLLAHVPEHISWVTVVDVEIIIVAVRTTSRMSGLCSWSTTSNLVVQALTRCSTRQQDGSTFMFFTALHMTVL